MMLFVNIQRLSGMALERALAVRLEELLGSIDWLHGWRVEHQVSETPIARFDLRTTLPLPNGGNATLYVECKRELHPSAFVMLRNKEFSLSDRRKLMIPVLAMPWVSERMAELCAEHKWSWFDLAGNCRLNIPGVLDVERTGHAPVHKRERPAANLSTREAGRVIRVLLHPGHVGMRWTQREIQKHCQPDVSLGLINKVIRHLRDQAFIAVSESGGFMVRDPVKLLFAWRDAYRFDRHERHGYFTL